MNEGQPAIVLAIVLTIFGSATICILAFIWMLKSIFTRGRRSEIEELKNEIRSLRLGVEALQRQYDDVILHLDSGLDRVTHRVDRLEEEPVRLHGAIRR